MTMSLLIVPKMKEMQPVLILDYPGALQSAVLGLRDMLSHAGLSPVIHSAPKDEAGRWGAVVLPPAAEMSDPSAAPQLVEWLRECAADGVLVCSACVGLNWVAAAGIDGNRPVTTHWGIVNRVRADWPALNLDTDRLVIEYSDLVTAGGMMAWIDLALIVIERLAGRERMLETARHFVVDPDRRDQRRFQRFRPITNHGDGQVLRVQRYLEKNHQQQTPVSDLAAIAAISARSLQRRFVASTGLNLTQYLQRIRMERAKSLLADSPASVSEIAAQTGYTDVPAFYRVFQRLTGMTPAGFRNMVRAGDGANG